MKKAYRNILIISVLLSVISLILLGNNFIASDMPGSILLYAIDGLSFTVIFAAVIGASYFVVERKGNAYLGILTFSILLMGFLFAMDYLVWDIATPPTPINRVIFELLVFGSMYVGIFFVLFSTIYYLSSQLFRTTLKLIRAGK